jgi:hypothetical protein
MFKFVRTVPRIPSSRSSSRAPTTSPITVTSQTSDVAPHAPTEGEEVTPISTSSSGRVLRRPTHYKDTRRYYLVFLFLLALSDVMCVSIFSVDPSLLSCIMGPSLLCFFFFLSTFLCSLGIRVGATTNLEGGSGRAVDLPSFCLRVKGSLSL